MTMLDTALVYQSPKLGDVSYSTEDVIRFPQGIPGFEQLRQFLLVTREECDPFIFLAALERPEVALPLMPLAPATLAVRPSRTALAPLGEAGEDAIAYYAGRAALADGSGAARRGRRGRHRLLCASIGLNAAEIIVNLRAPIVINLDTRLGCQVILPDETLPIAAPRPA